jgi:hypothetical protein
MAPTCYVAVFSDTAAQSLACTYLVGETLPLGVEVSALFDVLLMQWLLGAGYLLVAIFISQILVVRHLNETLPDHIYLRCFATEEERRRRLPINK